MKAICLIDTRNHARFIDECVRSCLAQEIPPGCDYEVHVVDAGSTDGTLEKLAAYGDRITLHPRDNIGQSGAFDLCLDLDADAFMFCDGDDRIKANRLSKAVEVFDAHPEVVMVGNAITEVDAAGNRIREVFVGEDQYLDARIDSDADRLYGARCLLGTSRMAVRKAALAKILPFDRVVLFEADEYIFNLLPLFGKVCILSERLTDYRLHGANNYQSDRSSMEKTTRFRLVHEELLSSLLSVRARLALTGRYIDLCENGLRTLCQRNLTFEEALHSRAKAVDIILHDPQAFGMVSASTPKRMFYAFIVLAFGLRQSLLCHQRLRRFLSKSASVQNAHLL